MTNASEPVPTLDFRAARQANLAALRATGIDPFAPNSYDVTAKAAQLQEKHKDLPNGEVTTDNVRVAGRITSYRNSGMFIDLLDDSGKIQIFSHKDSVDTETMSQLAILDLGDWIGVEGIIRRTPRGELTINLQKLTVLGKAMTPPPEKFHGLQDVDTRYRHREYDLVSNEDSRRTLRKRFEIIRELRNFMDGRGFIEVETPMLHVIPGGANARPFITHHNTLDMQLYMRIAPELHLKRLIIGGLADRVYEINRCFRNEGFSTRHNPEFTTLESYEAFTDYHGVMKLAEEAVEAVAFAVFGTTKFEFRGHDIDVKTPYPRKRMTDLVKEQTGIDFLTLPTFEDAKAAAQKIGIDVHACHNWGQVVEAAFAEKVEETLIQPVHVIDLPKDISPLAQGHRTEPLLTERFETYITGWEFYNGFSELSDPAEQRARFEAQMAQRDAGDEEAQHLDEDFIHALELGLPATGGLGIGIDRLVMLLTGNDTIREVVAFPTMRPRGGEAAAKPAAVKSAPAAVPAGKIELSVSPEVRTKFPQQFSVMFGPMAQPDNMKLKAGIKTLKEKIKTQLAGKNLDELPAIQHWRNIFAQMNAPQGNVASVEYLTRRFLETGDVPGAPDNLMVKFYNCLSVLYQVPMGSYDTRFVNGAITLRAAKPGEEFAPLGRPKETETTQDGEVIWVDDEKTLCRFWNKQDSHHSRLRGDTENLLLFVDATANSAAEAESFATPMLADIRDMLGQQPHFMIK